MLLSRKTSWVRCSQFFPDLYFCRDCAHVQLLDVINPALLFSDYVHVSGTSPVFVSHFREYANANKNKFELASGSLVVDIGSNDGTLLSFKRAGAQSPGS